jgi:hypothetical protein
MQRCPQGDGLMPPPVVTLIHYSFKFQFLAVNKMLNRPLDVHVGLFSAGRLDAARRVGALPGNVGSGAVG